MIFCKRLSLNQMSFILILLLTFNLALSIVNNNITHPKVYINKQILSNRIQAQNRKFSQSFPNIDFQINGQVFQTQNVLTGDEIYDLKNYNLSQSCVFYKTNFDFNLQNGIDLNYTAEHSVVVQEQRMVYVIGYVEPKDYNLPLQRFLTIYSFKKDQINSIETKSLGQTLLKKGFEQKSYILHYNSWIFISDGNTLYQTAISKKSGLSLAIVQGLNSNQNSMDFEFLGMARQGDTSLVLLYENKVAIYQIKTQSDIVKVALNAQIQKQDKLIYDVQFSKDQIFVLTQNILRIYKKQKLSNPVDIQLEGESCSRIYLSGDALQIVCSYKDLVYVAQYQYDSIKKQITLNRYYNDLSDYRFIQFLGQNNDKTLMIGDDQIVLTNFAINREILMDLDDGISNSQTIYSFGVQKIQTLKQFSNQLSITTLGIAEDFIVILKFDQIPPELQCNLEKTNASYINLLVVSNTSKCQFNSQESPLASICTNMKPIRIEISSIQIQKKMSVLFILLIVIMVLVVIFLCMGWIFNVNLNHKKLIQNIKQKIKKIKSSNKEMKKI